jgi:hypothetical protein
MPLDIARYHPVALLEAYRRRLDNERLGHFPCIVVRDLDDGAVVDSWVSEKMGLELCGSDLVTLCKPCQYNLRIKCLRE